MCQNDKFWSLASVLLLLSFFKKFLRQLCVLPDLHFQHEQEALPSLQMARSLCRLGIRSPLADQNSVLSYRSQRRETY